MRIKCFKIILRTKEDHKIFSFKSKKMPQVNEELVVFYNGANRSVKVEQVTQRPFLQVFASELDIIQN